MDPTKVFMVRLKGAGENFRNYPLNPIHGVNMIQHLRTDGQRWWSDIGGIFFLDIREVKKFSNSILNGYHFMC